MDQYHEKLEEFEYYYVDQDERNVLIDEDIRRLENTIGSPLPDDYKVFLMKYSTIAFGVYVLYPVGESCPSGDDGILSVLFGFSSDGTYNIEKNLDTYRGRMPSNFLPIASDPGGNILVISVSGEDRGKVYYWDHDHQELSPGQFKSIVADLKSRGIHTERLSTDEIILSWQHENRDRIDKPVGYSNTYLIADSFTAFFEALKTEDDEDD